VPARRHERRVAPNRRRHRIYERIVADGKLSTLRLLHPLSSSLFLQPPCRSILLTLLGDSKVAEWWTGRATSAPPGARRGRCGGPLLQTLQRNNLAHDSSIAAYPRQHAVGLFPPWRGRGLDAVYLPWRFRVGRGLFVQAFLTEVRHRAASRGGSVSAPPNQDRAAGAGCGGGREL